MLLECPFAMPPLRCALTWHDAVATNANIPFRVRLPTPPASLPLRPVCVLPQLPIGRYSWSRLSQQEVLFSESLNQPEKIIQNPIVNPRA